MTIIIIVVRVVSVVVLIPSVPILIRFSLIHPHTHTHPKTILCVRSFVRPSQSSMAIIRHICVKTKYRGTTYHQLVLGMSIYDCIRSTAYALSTVMVPENGGSATVHGNETTCAIQGFMIQLGIPSILYNMVLACYFCLIINYGVKERQIKKYLVEVHVLLFLIGLSLSLPAIPYFGPKFSLCHMVSLSELDGLATIDSVGRPVGRSVVCWFRRPLFCSFGR